MVGCAFWNGQINLLAIWVPSSCSCICQRHGVAGWPDPLSNPSPRQLFLTESSESLNLSHGDYIPLKTFFHFSLAYKVLNIFICLSIKPSVAVTGQSVDNKNKCMLMEQFHEMLTRSRCTTRHVMERVSRETWESHPGTGFLDWSFIIEGIHPLASALIMETGWSNAVTESSLKGERGLT